MDNIVKGVISLVILILIVVFLIGGGLYGCASYNVWGKEMKGKAAFAEAQQDRQIKVLEAQANLEATRLNAQAEVARAHGTNEANHIMSKALGGPENYLRWSYIHMLQETSNKPNREVIYLPTEAGMPILEASRNQRPIAIQQQATE